MTVRIVPHAPEWAGAFAIEARELKRAIGDNCLALHHIGSTAIPGILAKPIIDILGEVLSLDRMDAATGNVEALGYDAMGAYGIEGRRYFRKLRGNGRRTHHLHVFAAASLHIERHLAFRDFLRVHPEEAFQYSALKAALVESGVPYQEGKSAFVAKIEAEAIDWYRSGAR